MPKPNFFILGAAKSGTTSLHQCLSQHPDIYMSPVKEPTFYNQGFQIVNNAADYFSLFDAAGTASIVGEASTAYLSDPGTPALLKEGYPDAKFLVILRNPADRAYSLYHHMRRHGFEWISSFERALAAEDRRGDSKEFQENCPCYLWNYLYFRSGLYGEQLARYFALFDRRQFHLLSFAELIADPADCVDGILRFLGVDRRHPLRLELHNEGGSTARITAIQYFWRTRMCRNPKFERRGFKLLYKFNSMKAPPLASAVRTSLLTRYQPDFEFLYKLTGRRFFDPAPTRVLP